MSCCSPGGRPNARWPRITVTVEPLEPLTKAQLAELDEQVQRVGEILEGTAELTIGEATAGPHA